MVWLVPANLSQSRLSNAVDDVATSLDVLAGDRFSDPAGVNSSLLAIVDNTSDPNELPELCVFTDRTSDTLSGLTRGVSPGSAARGHSAGAYVYEVVGFDLLTQIAAGGGSMSAADIVAALVAYGGVGDSQAFGLDGDGEFTGLTVRPTALNGPYGDVDTGGDASGVQVKGKDGAAGSGSPGKAATLLGGAGGSGFDPDGTGAIGGDAIIGPGLGGAGAGGSPDGIQGNLLARNIPASDPAVIDAVYAPGVALLKNGVPPPSLAATGATNDEIVAALIELGLVIGV